jgi:hypothetical protein
MATYYLDSAAAGAGTGADWTNAFTTLTAALAAATSNGDVIKFDDGHTEEVAADTDYTFGANISIICVDKNSSDALSTQGTAAWIGNSTTNRTIRFIGARRAYIYGMTVRTAGSVADNMQPAISDGAHYEFENCYLWNGNTSTASGIFIGAADAQVYFRMRGGTLRFGATAQRLAIGGNVELDGVTVASAGSAPSTFTIFNQTRVGGAYLRCTGCDLSHCGSGSLVGDATFAAGVAEFIQCILGASYVMLATQTVANRSGAEVWVRDCSSGDSHGLMGHANTLGSTVSDTGIYLTAGAAGQSWKIVTTANASYYTPYESPWISGYHTGTSAITPYIEILRDGSATAYQDDEVWAEFMFKGTASSTRASFSRDRMTPLGTPANQAAGAGTGSWTGEGTAWSGKLDSGSSITPAEAGDISGRIVVGEPSITVYADPAWAT